MPTGPRPRAPTKCKVISSSSEFSKIQPLRLSAVPSLGGHVMRPPMFQYQPALGLVEYALRNFPNLGRAAAKFGSFIFIQHVATSGIPPCYPEIEVFCRSIWNSFPG